MVKPLTDPFFEQYMNEMLRSRFTKDCLITFKDTFRAMIRNKSIPSMTIIAADQTPTRKEINYWATFLNQDTPVFLGLEKISKSLDFPIVFFDIQRQKRGHYMVEITLLFDDPKNTQEYEITDTHVSFLEQAIQKNPSNWLWSHKRWKHRKQ